VIKILAVINAGGAIIKACQGEAGAYVLLLAAVLLICADHIAEAIRRKK
jgi:hypothetical protein